MKGPEFVPPAVLLALFVVAVWAIGIAGVWHFACAPNRCQCPRGSTVCPKPKCPDGCTCTGCCK